MVGVAGAWVAPQEPGPELGVHGAEALQLLNLQQGVDGFWVVQVLEGQASLGVQGAAGQFCRGKGCPGPITRLALIHTVGP